MSDSLLIRLTDDWIRYMQEFDVENLALITTPSFTFYGIDENQNVTTIPKTEFLRRFKDQVKPVHPRSDVRVLNMSLGLLLASPHRETHLQIRILRRDIKRAETVEVVADVRSFVRLLHSFPFG